MRRSVWAGRERGRMWCRCGRLSPEATADSLSPCPVWGPARPDAAHRHQLQRYAPLPGAPTSRVRFRGAGGEGVPGARALAPSGLHTGGHASPAPAPAPAPPQPSAVPPPPLEVSDANWKNCFQLCCSSFFFSFSVLSLPILYHFFFCHPLSVSFSPIYSDTQHMLELFSSSDAPRFSRG